MKLKLLKSLLLNMFGNEEELKDSIPNIIRVAIINSNPKINDLNQRILQKIGFDFKERLKINYTSNYNDIYKDLDKLSFQKENQASKGLINTKWIDDICNKRPALIIYYHYIPNGANKNLEEKKMYENLIEIKKYDELVSIFLFIISSDMKENPYNFNTDAQKQYNLRNLVSKECIFVFPNEEFWKMIDFGNFCNNIIHFSRLYYKRYKNKIKEKKIKAGSREEKIEYNIILAVLSIIKTKKIAYNKNKYLDEAYELICQKKFNINKYLYGVKPNNSKYNFSEVRAVADWLFYKIMSLQNIKLPNPPQLVSNNTKLMSRSLTNSLLGKNPQNLSYFEQQIEKYQNHIKNFSYISKYIKDNDTIFLFIEYYWLIKRNQDLCELYEENMKNSSSKSKILSLGMIYFKQIYYYIKIIQFLNKNKSKNINAITIKNKEVPINKIEIEFSKFYGKPPSYSYKDIHNPLIKLDLGFNEDIYFKKFIYDKKLNVDGALNELSNLYLTKMTIAFKKLNSIKSNFKGGINLYFNILKILSNESKENNIFNISNLKINENIFKLVSSFPNLSFNSIKKFPKVYLHYLELITNSLIYNLNDPAISNQSKSNLFINLSLLGSIRKLKNNEENIFFQLLNDEQFLPKNINEDNKAENTESKPIIIKLNKDKESKDLIFDFEYNLKDGDEAHEKKILDLVEYNFKIKTYLSKENIKFNSIKIFFQCFNEDERNNEKNIKKETIIKEYNKEELNNFELSLNSPVNLEHKLFMKYRKGKMYITRAELTLCKKENIIYQIDLPCNINKMIFLTNLNKKVLNIKVPKEKLTVGVNQLNVIECEVNKEELDEVQIADFKMNFFSIPSYFKKATPSTSIRDLLSSNSTPSKPSNTKTNASQKIFGLPKNTINPKDSNQANISQNSMQNFFNKSPTTDKQNIQLQNNNMYKSQIFPSSTASLKSPTPPVKIKDLPNDKNQTPLPFPEFYFYNEENKTLDKSEKTFEKEYKNFESLLKANKNKYGVLIKFLEAGQYEIRLNITYSIRHRDIEDYFIFNHEEALKFIVIDPFKFSNEINSNNFVTTTIKEDKTEVRSIEYLTNRNIQMKLILTNLLNEDVIIKDIIFQLDEEKLSDTNKNIEVKSSVKSIVDSKSLPSEIKNQILKIMKTADYTIPIETKFNEKFKGSLGKIKINWSTPSLISYQCGELSLSNDNAFEMPYIVVNPTELNFQYETSTNERKDILFNVKVSNSSERSKKIIFIIENGNDANFIMSGLTKQIYSIKSKDILNIVFRLIPLAHNIELKLPKIKICEMGFYSQEKLCSIYFYPEIINI